jgi:hypothetical protein
MTVTFLSGISFQDFMVFLALMGGLWILLRD